MTVIGLNVAALMMLMRCVAAISLFTTCVDHSQDHRIVLRPATRYLGSRRGLRRGIGGQRVVVEQRHSRRARRTNPLYV